MYEQHWGLASLGYQNLPDPSVFFPSAQHQQALTLLHYAVQNDKGTILLTGEIGCGKTTLTRALVLQLAEDRFEVGVITNPSLPPQEFLEEINVQLNDRFLLALVLVGQPELTDYSVAIPQFGQRIAVRCHLGPRPGGSCRGSVRLRRGGLIHRPPC